MFAARAYQEYDGGKSGNGTYQNIINHIPPHDCFYSLFLGNCAITHFKKPAAFNILNDLDPAVIANWQKLNLPSNFELKNEKAIVVLCSIAKKCDTAVKNFIYLDPPYRFAVRKYQGNIYRFEMSDKDHSDLLSQIVAMSDQNIMISHYPDEMYNEALKDWHTFDFKSIVRGGTAVERIYYNYELTDKLHDYSYIGKDFREREALSRQKKNFLKKLQEFSPHLRNAIICDITSQDNAMRSRG